MSRTMTLSLCRVVTALLGCWTSSLLAQEAPATIPPAGLPGAQAISDAAGEQGKAYQLTYKFRSGESVKYETSLNAKFVSQFKSTEETSANRTETKKHYDVIQVHPDGSAELEVVLDWVRMKVNFGTDDTTSVFDSSDPDAKEQRKFQHIYRNVGKPQGRVLCAPNGKITKVLAGFDSGSGGNAPVQVKGLNNQEDGSFLTILPENPIRVGDTWVENSTVKVAADQNQALQRNVVVRRTYQLKSVEGNLAKITFKTAVLTPNLEKSVQVQLIQRETFGELVFDIERGIMASRIVDTDKSVINPVGDNTAMHSKSHLLEQLITQTADASSPPEASTVQQ